LCLLPFHTPTTTSTRKDDKPTVCYRRQWNPCHMDFDLVFQQVIDRQDRNKLKDASATGTTGDTPLTGHSHYRTRTRLMTTCLVGHTPLRLLLLLLLRNDDKPTRKLATNLAGAFASEPSHRTGHRDYTGHQDYQPPTLTTDYFARPTNGNRSLTGISHLVTNIGLFPLPFMYTQYT